MSEDRRRRIRVTESRKKTCCFSIYNPQRESISNFCIGTPCSWGKGTMHSWDDIMVPIRALRAGGSDAAATPVGNHERGTHLVCLLLLPSPSRISFYFSIRLQTGEILSPPSPHLYLFVGISPFPRCKIPPFSSTHGSGSRGRSWMVEYCRGAKGAYLGAANAYISAGTVGTRRTARGAVLDLQV